MADSPVSTVHESGGLDGTAFFDSGNSGGREDVPWEEAPLRPVDEDGDASSGDGESNPQGDGKGDSGQPENAGKPGQGSSASQPAGTFSEADTALAKQWGFNDEQIKAFPSAAALRTALGGISARFTREPEQGAGRPNEQPAPQVGPDSSLDVIMSSLKPENLLPDLSKLPAYAGLSEEAQGVFQSYGTHFAKVVHEIGERAAREIKALRSQVAELEAQQDHGTLRAMMSGLDPDLAESAKRYLGWNKDSVVGLEKLRRAVLGMPNDIAMDTRIRTVLLGLHGDEINKASESRRAKELGENQRKLGAHAAGPGSTRRSVTAKRGRTNAVEDTKAILERHGCR